VAKTRAQRKAEQRRRAEQGVPAKRDSESRAQRRTQAPKSADVVEAELAEAGVEIPSPTDKAEPQPQPPAPSRADVGVPAEAEVGQRLSRREAKRLERERQARAKESERRRAPRQAPVEKRRSGVLAFFASCWAELKKVQWPNRETLVQASAVTVLFIAVAAAYLGALDSLFNFLVQHLL
jgi:preprotein translocase SecE subunit